MPSRAQRERSDRPRALRLLADAPESAVCGEDVIYFSMCSGGVIIKISAADRPTFVLGQHIIFGAIVVVALVELTLWLVN